VSRIDPTIGSAKSTVACAHDAVSFFVKMEVTMAAQSSMHFYLNWAKERIDEMDAVLASVEANASKMQADSRVKADQFIADLRKKRAEFQDAIKKQADAGETAWQGAKGQMENSWNGFEADFKKYVETFGKQVEQQQATFKGVAAAQLKAWRDAAEKINSAAAGLAADRRTDIDAALKQMKADASEVEANLQKLTRAGSESWGALGGALAESRAAFDRANQVAWDAFKRAANPGA
jgi:hypothetical protein